MRFVPSAPEPRTQTLLAFQIGGLRLALTRDGSTVRRPTARPFGMGAFTGLAVATLALAGASAAPRPEALARYSVSVDVPARVARAARPTARPSPGRIARLATPVAPAIDVPFEGPDAPYVARAMATGAFQEWEGADGQLRFLTAGPARAEGGRTCRDMALLIRLAEGGSRVRSAERCTTEPVSDPAPAADAVIPPQD